MDRPTELSFDNTLEFGSWKRVSKSNWDSGYFTKEKCHLRDLYKCKTRKKEFLAWFSLNKCSDHEDLEVVE